MSKKLLGLILIIYFVAVFITYFSGDYESLAVQAWNLIPSLLAAGCGLIAVRAYAGIDNPHAKAIAFMALGVFFWFIGDFIWFVFEYFLNQNPFPSIADYFYLLAYPMLLFGMIIELQNNKLTWNAKKIALSTTISLILGIIVIYFGIIRAYIPSDPLLNNLVAMSYGVGDVVLIILASTILMVAVGYRKGRLFYPWLCILIGFFLILAADILFAIYRDEYENFVGMLRNIDLGWISGFLFIAFGFFSIGNAVRETCKKLLGFKQD